MDVLIPLFVTSLMAVGYASFAMRRLPADERAFLVRTFTIAFAIRAFAAALFAIIPALRLFHEDATGYESVGLRLAMAWTGQTPSYIAPILPDQNWGYFWVCGAIYSVLPFRAAPSLVNSLVGASTVHLVYLLSREFFNVRVCKRSALLVAFVPSMILWSSVALKDPLVSFLVVLALFGCVQLKGRVTTKGVMMTVLPLAALQPLRFYMIYFVGFAILMALIAERGIRSVSGIYKQLVVVGGLVALLALTGMAGRFAEGTDFLSLERVSQFRHGMATTANTGFATDVDISTPGRAIAFLPVGVATLLLAPFPWQMTSLRAALAAPETVVWWYLFPSVIMGIRFAIRKRWAETSPLIIFSATLTLAYSLVHGNVGSGFRQRAQIFVFLFIFAALGTWQRRCRRAGIDEDLLLAEPLRKSE